MPHATNLFDLIERMQRRYEAQGLGRAAVDRWVTHTLAQVARAR